jgi:aldehyde:ferredoxin oxidoreductase
MREVIGIEPGKLSTLEKMAIIRKYREDRYETLVDSVYKRRGWTRDGIPTVNRLIQLGVDFPDVLNLAQKFGG